MQFPDVFRMASLLSVLLAGNISRPCHAVLQRFCPVFSSEGELFRGLRRKAYTVSFKNGDRERLSFP